ncbi:hypothetical protein G5S34_14425 [Herbaspirillum frisingense]|nr:hypothetical protein G5S34_14425 [Herbaspirillum frisingense]
MKNLLPRCGIAATIMTKPLAWGKVATKQTTAGDGQHAAASQAGQGKAGTKQGQGESRAGAITTSRVASADGLFQQCASADNHLVVRNTTRRNKRSNGQDGILSSFVSASGGIHVILA